MSSRASLNHIFRTVWNQALGAMVAVAEISSGSGGRSKGACNRGTDRLQAPPRFSATVSVLSLGIAVAWGALPASALANPGGGVAIVGQASMVNQGNKLTVTTQNAAGSNHSAINWQSFSVPAGNTTYFQQPNAGSTSVNRVVTNTPSLLFGTLGSNGNLVLVNQSGIAVGTGAVVDTAGFTASSLRMSDADALGGRLRFGDGSAAAAAVSVQGSILARSGDVVLLGSRVDTGKDALIQAPNGSTILAAGQQIELTGRGLEGITLQVQAPADQAINLGTLQGDAVGIFAGTLKHSGLIQATAASLEGGKVVLKAATEAYVEGAGRILANGTVGGTVDVLGNRVAVMDQAVIDVSGEQGGGSVRVGGDYQGKNPDVQNANITYLGPQASINADAKTRGDGGKVIVWADDTTRAYGNISARGGDQGGHGGFVETSGHRYLDVNGIAVDTNAPRGQMGTWLLDPTNIYIAVDQTTATRAGMSGTDASVDSSGPSTFQATGFATDSLLTTSTLQSNLANNSVTVSTVNNAGYGGGVISVVSPVTWANSNSLTLTANGSININASISAPLGALSLNAGTGYGAVITQGYGASITAAALTATTSANFANITLTELNNVGTASFTAGPVGYGGNVNFTNAGALTVGNVTASGLTVNTSSGNGAIVQSAGTSIVLASSGASFTGGSGNLTLTNSGNVLRVIGIASAGAAQVNDSGTSFSIGNITAGSFTAVAQNNVTSTSTITTTGAVDIRSTGADIDFCTTSCATVSATGTIRLQAVTGLDVGNLTSLANGDAVSLISTGGLLTANSRSGSIATTNGRALAYVNENNTCGGNFTSTCHDFSGLTPVFKQYNASFGTTVAGSGDGVLYSGTAFLRGGLTGTVTKTYNGSTSISLSGAGLGAPLASNVDNLTTALLVSGTGALTDKNVGTGKLVTAQQVVVSGVTGTEGANLTVYGYGFDTNNVLSGNIGNVTLATITAVSNITASNKVYDGNTTATVNTASATMAGAISGDNLSVTGAGAFSDKNAGLGKTVNITGLSLGGTDAANYTLGSTTASTSADIGKATISAVSGITASNKVYDGNTTATVNTAAATLAGAISGDNLSVTGAGAFIDKNAGLGKTVNITGLSLGGTDAANYTLGSTTASSSADIGKATISAVSGITASNKVYDGNTTASVNTASATLAGAISGDNLSVTGSGAFSDKNAGLGKTVNITGLSLGGTDAANYTLGSGTSSTTANITPANLSVTANNDAKTYDRIAYSGGNGVSYAGFVNSETAAVLGGALTYSGTSQGAVNAGSYLITPGGLASGNYSFNYVNGILTISPVGVGVIGLNGTRVYDGTNIVNAGIFTITGLLGGDTLSLTGSGTVADKNVGLNKPVTQGSLSLGNGSGLASNYTLSGGTQVATITPALITGVSGISAGNKVYDGNTTATVNTAAATLAGAISGDNLSVTGAGAFIDKNAGLGKTVNITGLSLGGTDAANYTLGSTTASSSADIGKATISAVSGITANNKVYDGNTNATVNTAAATFGGLVSGDNVTIGAVTAAFVDRHVGVGKTVNITNVALNGTDAANYIVASVIAPTQGTITVRPLSTWAAAGGGLWSEAGNWDALPDGSNVLAVSIPVGASVVYDAAVGATNLQSINSAGAVTLADGNLSVAGSLTTPQYSQTGGTLTGAGSLVVNGSFAQTGGTIAMAGPVGVTQTSGNLSVGSVQASSISLAAPGGGIGQSAALVTSGLLTTQSSTGTVLNDPGNRIGSFKSATTGAGNIELTNVGVLDVQDINAANGNVALVNTGAISTSGTVVANGGSVSMIANSPLTIGSGGVVASGDITLTATNLTSAGDMTLDGDLTSRGGAITLDAANNFVQNSTLTAARGITVSAGGSITFGPNANSVGNPLSYRANGLDVLPPGEFWYQVSIPSDFVLAFLIGFDSTVTAQYLGSADPFKPPSRGRNGVVVEGEICSR